MIDKDYLKSMIMQECAALNAALLENAQDEVVVAIKSRMESFFRQLYS